MSYDVLRDSYIRYFGYANHIANILGPMAPPKFVLHKNNIMLGYFALDGISNTIRPMAEIRPFKMIFQAGDVAIFHGLASLAIPAVALDKVMFYAHMNVDKYFTTLSAHNRKLMVIGIGLISITFMSGPIDLIVNVAMNMSYRLILRTGPMYK